MKILFHMSDYIKTFRNLQTFIDTGDNSFEVYLDTFGKHLGVQYKKMNEYHICTYINDITSDKLLIQNMDEIIQGTSVSYQELTQRALTLSGALYAALNIYGENKDFFHTVALAGVSENILKGTKILGFRIEGKRWNEDPIRAERIRCQTLSRFASCLDLTGKTLPKTLVRKIETLFHLGVVYICKITKDYQTIGDFTLIFEKGKEIKNKNALIAYSQQVALKILKHRTEEKYKSIVNYSNDAIYIHGFDEDGTPDFFTEVNQKACEELGYTREELLQLRPWEIDYTVNKEEKASIISELFDKGFVRFEGQHRRKDGTPFHVEIHTGLMNDNGTQLAISVVRNIEARKKHEKKLGLYKKIISTITDSMTFISRDMRFMMVNDTFAGYYHAKPETLEGQAVEQVMGSAFFESTVKANILKTLNGEAAQYETWFKDADQRTYYMNVRCYPYYDEDGTVIGCMTHGRDMTLEKQMKDEILRNHELLSKIIEMLPGTITLINKEYEILLTNKKSEKLSITQFDSTDVFIGKRCYEIFHHRKTPCPWCASQKVFETGVSVFEKTTPEDPREKLTGQAYQLYYAPVKDDTGEITGCIEYVTNVTQYREALKKIEEALENKTEALSSLSHEIRNQMNGMLNLSELIKLTGFDRETEGYLDRLIHSGKDLMKILENTLRMSKFESGNIELEMTETDLTLLLHGVIEHVQPQAFKRQNKLHVEISETVQEVFADDVRLKQVLINLLNNASKFTESGKIQLILEKISETDESVTVKIAVKDTGIGIPAGKQSDIFNAYDQGVVKAHSGYGGTGIGLTISNKLLALMGSTLTLESVEGQGSTFSFELTLNKVETASKTINPGLLSLQTIMIADDHDISRVLAETMIRMRYPDTQILIAENGEDAISLYKAYKPAFIMLDIQMPKLNGLEVTKRIRALEAERDKNDKTIIIGYSAVFNPSQIEEALKTGMNDFVQKPLMKHILYNCLENNGF